MTKLTPENLRGFLDYIVSRPNIKRAARSVGVGHTQIFEWLARSNNGDPALMVDWPEGSEPKQLCEHMITARKRNIVLFEAQLRDETGAGIERMVIHNGELQYRKDPTWIGVSDQTMIDLGFDPEHDRYERDELGRVIPLTVLEAAPAHLKIHVSRGMMPGVYGDHRSVTVDARVTGGVMVVHRKQAPAPAIAHKPEVPMIEQSIVDVEAEPVEVAAPAPAPAQTEDPLADKPGDRPDILELKRMARAKRDAHPRKVGAPAAPPPARVTVDPPRYRSPEDRAEGIGAIPDSAFVGGFKVR